MRTTKIWELVFLLSALLFAGIVALGMSGCGGTAAIAAAALPVSPLAATAQTCAPGETGVYPNCVAGGLPQCGAAVTGACTPAPVCAVGGAPGNNGCTCPAGTSLATDGTCELPAPPLVCAVGGAPGNNGCTCPAGTSVNNAGLCEFPVPPPPTCPAGTYYGGTAVGCVAEPFCQLNVALTTPILCVCPAGDSINALNECATPPPPPSCSAYPNAYWGGSACECPAVPYTGTYPNCIAPACANGALDYPTCVVVTCPAGDSWNGTACAPIVCAAGESPPNCAPTPCPAPATGTLLSGCICPVFQTWSNASGSCIVPAPDTFSCTAYIDPNTNNSEALCAYASPVSGDSCSIYEVAPNVAGPFGGNTSGTNVVVPLPAQGATYQLQCTLSVSPPTVSP